MCAKHKYIRKYLSKNGKWVYVYSDKMDKMRRSFDPLNKTLAGIAKRTGLIDSKDRRSVVRPHKRGQKATGSQTGWKPITNAASVYDGVREGTDLYGNRQTQYRDRNYYHSQSYQVAMTNDAIKKDAGIKINSRSLGKQKVLFGNTARKIMDLNDKYGPKYISHYEEKILSTGQVYVTQYETNLFGGRDVKLADAYVYFDRERRVKKTNAKRSTRRRGGVMQHADEAYLMHHGIKGQKERRTSMSDYLAHHGTKGMKWGIRRYQNLDGTLTDAGKKRYGYGYEKGSKEYESRHQRAYRELRKDYDKFDKMAKKARASAKASPSPSRNHYADVMDDAAILTKQAMNKSLKELGMGKKEIAYREAGYNYTKHLQGSFGAHVAANLLAGPIGTVAYTAYRASNSEGKRLEKEYSKASRDYRGR